MEDKKKPLILIADDNIQNLQVLGEMVEKSGYESVLALNGQQVFEFMDREQPDLVLLDVMMPLFDGYEVCKTLKSNKKTKDVPIIFLTAKADTEDVVMGFESGAVDFVAKPFNAVELDARIKNHLELKRSRDELKEYNEQLKKANNELKEAYNIISVKNQQLKEIMDKLEEASKTDPLTDLFNRRHVIEKIDEELIRYKRNKRAFSLIIADIDFFKKVNDSYGHDCGDYVLKAISQIMRKSIREQDSLARWGGEEFLFLLPETEIEGAKILSEKVRKRIESHIFNYQRHELSVTMTFGVTAYDNGDIYESIKKADSALYIGKAIGRNCVVVAT